jgi:hypothetical protein
MTAVAVEKNLSEKRDKRAKSIAAMGLVNREGDRFLVSTPSLRGKQTSYEVWRSETGKIRCNCLEFEEAAVSDLSFRCEHILAVKYALVAKNTESATKQPLKVETQIEVKPTEAVVKDTSATESSEDLESRNEEDGFDNEEFKIQNPKSKIQMSKDGEQKADEVRENVSELDTPKREKFPSRVILRTHKETKK